MQNQKFNNFLNNAKYVLSDGKKSKLNENTFQAADMLTANHPAHQGFHNQETVPRNAICHTQQTNFIWKLPIVDSQYCIYLTLFAKVSPVENEIWHTVRLWFYYQTLQYTKLCVMVVCIA